jgi:glyoxylase-like metal-dependent hydrolase (beta-lactamase superfamily II)
MKEILTGIYQWSWFSEEKGYDFNGHLIMTERGRVLIDPPPLSPDDQTWVDRQGRLTCILLTNRDHVRESDYYRALFKTIILAPEPDAPMMEIHPDQTYKPGDRIPGGLQAIRIPDGKSPGETALLLNRGKGVLILGDALIGKPAGRLGLMPPEKYKDAARAKEGLRVLLNYDFDAVLVGDGVSILKGGKKAVEEFLSQS